MAERAWGLLLGTCVALAHWLNWLTGWSGSQAGAGGSAALGGLAGRY